MVRVVVIDDTDFTNALGTYTIRYNATDANGNIGIEVTRTVTVADITAPVITLIGDSSQTIEQGVGYTELGATADDGSDIVINSSNFVDSVGSYTISYNATDANGNIAAEVIRTINVVKLEEEQGEELSDIRIYPNPVVNHFTVDGLNNNNSSVFIFDIQGGLIKRIDNYEPEQLIDISNLSSGVYYLRILIDNKLKIQKPILKN